MRKINGGLIKKNTKQPLEGKIKFLSQAVKMQENYNVEICDKGKINYVKISENV